MKITQADMDSRKRMAALRSSLSEVMGQHEGITYGELLSVLADVTRWWAGCLRKDELEEDEPGND
jgi:hypothetical protein